MNIGNFIKRIFYFVVLLFFIGAFIAYFMGIIPTSIGIHTKIYKSSNVAMDGYDMVNYHFNKNVNKGDVRFNYKHNDINWFFISSRNMKAFKAKPNKFIPQFGGYCTYTMKKGFTYPPDPSVWHLYNGRLYFFKDKESKKLAIADWENVLENAKMHWK